ncbi:AAA family ATPase [Streptomyces sp. NRRL S-920]|uniref:AAA family ATPase n=1 Tax=Streptomyces sp. NRRL S-920 TaxID=1463921 RepID=UPI0004C49AC9|nr:AAA family ATPase [Streptomyces sp. NRRL S-920]
MTERHQGAGQDLFFRETVDRYVKAPRFVHRDWLAKKVTAALGQPDCRMVLLTGQPGVGKSGLMAQLAEKNPDWLVYFIRRDQRSPLSAATARAMLLRVGFQLVALRPELFDAATVRVVVEQRIGEVLREGSAAAADVDRVIGSPFHQTVLELRQEVARNGGAVTGLRVREWVADPRLVSLDDLTSMALLDPAAALRRIDPHARIVIVVDALDEVPYQPVEMTLLSWLASVDLPDNVRLLLTSRPEPLLDTLKDRKGGQLAQLKFPSTDARVRGDLTEYARLMLSEPYVTEALDSLDVGADEFVGRATDKAEGNIGYLDAIGRAVDQAVAESATDGSGDRTSLASLLALDRLPSGLDDLYAFFLRQLRNGPGTLLVRINDPGTGISGRAKAWTELYHPVLEVLSVALEPLTAAQLRDLTGTLATDVDLVAAVQRLSQFLDRTGGRYRLYHATLGEFLHANGTRRNADTAELAVDALAAHRRLAARLRAVGDLKVPSEASQRGPLGDYGLRYLAVHLDGAGWHAELRDLLVGDRHWMDAKFTHLGGDRSYVAELDLASKRLTTPLAPARALGSAQLAAARCVVNQRVAVLEDPEIRLLVALGREAEALGQVRLRPMARDRLDGLLLVDGELRRRGRGDPTVLADVADDIVALALDDGDNSLVETYGRRKTETLVYLALAQDAWGRAGKLADDLERALPDMRGISWPHCRATALAEVARAYATLGLVDEAWSAVRTGVDHAERPELVPAIAEAAAAAGAGVDSRDVYALAGGSPRDRWFATANSKRKIALWAALLSSGALDEALAAIGNLQPGLEAGEYAECLGRLASILDRHGRSDEAGKVFKQARRAARSIDPPTRRGFALGKLVALLVDAGRNRAVSRVLEDLEETAAKSWHEPDVTELSLVSALLTAGKIDAAAHRAKSTRSLVALAKALIKAGRIDGALRVLDQCEADYLVTTLAYRSIVEAAGRLGDFEAARRALAANPNEEDREALCGLLAIALAQADRQQEAREVYDTELRAPEHRVPVLRAMVESRAARSDTVGASAAYAELDGELHLRRDPLPHLSALRALAAALYRTGHRRHGRAVLNHATTEASTVVDMFRRYEELRDLAILYADAGQPRKVEQIARSILDSRDDRPPTGQGEEKSLAWVLEARAEAVRDITEALADRRRFDLARTVGLKIKDEFYCRNCIELRRQALACVASTRVGERTPPPVVPFAPRATQAEASRPCADLRALEASGPDELIRDIADRSVAFEAVEPNLVVKALKEAMRISGWVRADWRHVHDLLSDL